MARPERTSTSGSQARRPILKLAPKEYQCEWVICDDSGDRRCSRFTLKKKKAGEREKYCVSHSRSARAKAYRSKAASAQREAQEARKEELTELAWMILPLDWRRRWDFNETRFRLFHHLVRGDLTVAQCKALAALVRDAERNATTPEHAWRGNY